MKQAQEQIQNCKYERLIQDFVNEGELAMNDISIENICTIGFKKMRLAKRFADIDSDILNLSLKSPSHTDNDTSFTGSFFTNLIFLEAKRLRFKEEVIKCQEKAINKTKIKT